LLRAGDATTSPFRLISVGINSVSEVEATFAIMEEITDQPERSPTYPDMPPWHPHDNFDGVRKRTINAAWHHLMTRELHDISFRELAKASSVTTQAMYYYFKDREALGSEIAVLAAIKLQQEANAALRRSKQVSRAIRAILDFAQKRPNHFRLIIFARPTRNVRHLQKEVFDLLGNVLHRLLRREPTAAERSAMGAHVLGAATLVSSGILTVDVALTTLVATLRAWRHRRRR
jgi:AcrR family transcriptional regulator